MTFVAGAGAEEAVVSLFIQVFSPSAPFPCLETGVAAPLLPQVAPAAPWSLRGELVAPLAARRPVRRLLVENLPVPVRHEGDLVLSEVHVVVDCAALRCKQSQC